MCVKKKEAAEIVWIVPQANLEGMQNSLRRANGN